MVSVSTITYIPTTSDGVSYCPLESVNTMCQFCKKPVEFNRAVLGLTTCMDCAKKGFGQFTHQVVSLGFVKKIVPLNNVVVKPTKKKVYQYMIGTQGFETFEEAKRYALRTGETTVYWKLGGRRGKVRINSGAW